MLSERAFYDNRLIPAGTGFPRYQNVGSKLLEPPADELAELEAGDDGLGDQPAAP